MEEAKKENETVRNWKAKLDELEEKLLKGQAKMEEEFEKHKVSFKTFLTETKSKLDNWQDLDEVKKVKVKIAGLEDNLADLKAEGLKAFIAHKENVEEEIDKLSVNLKDAGEKAKNEFEEWKAKMKVKADDYKNQFETARMNLIGDPDDGKESILEKTKAEAREKIGELKAKISAAMDTADDKWDDFKNEVSEGFSKIGSAFKGLFKKEDDKAD
jgi:ElaB/YqjD/DUF883 family membrane-anchored ribosome-binding protein